MISITELRYRPGLINALRPPFGKLQYLKVISNTADETSYELTDTVGTLLGRQIEGANETFLGHPTLEIIDTSPEYDWCDVLDRGTFVGWFGRAMVVHA